MKKLLSRIDTAKEYGIPAATLAKLAWQGDGPPYIKIGRRVYYFRESIDLWLAKNERSSTSGE